MFSKSEKWLLVVVIVWGMCVTSTAMYAAWVDAVRYASAVDALGRSAEVIVGALITSATIYSVYRHKYKEEIIKQNGNNGSEK